MVTENPEPQSRNKRILAVIVLYKMTAEESPSFLSLRSLMAANAEAAEVIDLILCDNTPFEQAPPAGFDGLYVSDTTNPGLAKCYNFALKTAEERGIPWLLLLDHDTTLTAEYLEEVLLQTVALAGDKSISAMIPKLVELYVVLSPHVPPTHRHREFDPKIEGKSESRLYAFNSGSVTRVEALRKVGGFPEEFWLDFLDHATFHLIQEAGGRFFVLHASLRHDLSMADSIKSESVSAQRYANALDAEYRFYRRYGSRTERLYRRIRLLRGVFGTLRWKRQLRPAWVLLRSAMRP